jgi:hypothetical protein
VSPRPRWEALGLPSRHGHLTGRQGIPIHRLGARS